LIPLERGAQLIEPHVNTATRKAHANDVPEPMVALLCKDCGKPTGRQVRKAVVGKSIGTCAACCKKNGFKPQQAKNQTAVAEAHNAKNQAAVELGRAGGLKGGPARARKLTPEQRSDIARKGALARWTNKEHSMELTMIKLYLHIGDMKIKVDDFQTLDQLVARYGTFR
jgi:hypothetical protein